MRPLRMKPKGFLPLILLCFLAFPQAKAQNYALMNPNRDFLFGNDFPDLNWMIHIDSSSQNGNQEIFYPYRELQKEWWGSNCRRVDAATWMGEAVVHDGNGNYTFVNNDGDSIRVESRATLGQSWRVMDLDSTGYLQATVTEEDTKFILRASRPYKKISLQAYDNLGNLISHQADTTFWEISEEFGWLTVPDFRNFPEHPQTYSLKGATNPEIGIQLPTREDIFDFEVGDVFHYVTSELSSGGSTYEERFYHFSRTVDSKTALPGGEWEYQESIYQVYILGYWTIQYGIVYDTTISSTSRTLNSTDFYPVGRPLALDSVQFFRGNDFQAFGNYKIWDRCRFHQSPDLNGRIVRTFKYESARPSRPDGNGCLLQETPPGNSEPYALSEQKFAEGLGIISWSDGSGDQYYSSYAGKHGGLVYFRKGNEIWGTPDSLLLTDPPIIEPPIELTGFMTYPLPVEENLQIDWYDYETGDFFHGDLFDTQGRQILELPLTQQESTSLNVSGLQAGLYYLRIENSQGEPVIVKVVVQ